MPSNVKPAPNSNPDAATPSVEPRLIEEGWGAAQGRLSGEGPVAVIDIGSNSVRLVVYERLSRAPTVLFNEKILCGLGRAVAATGMMDEEAVTRALAAIQRFKALCGQMGVKNLEALATAAAREASNGPSFLQSVAHILGCDVDVLSGKQEAHRSALGVISGFHNPDGIMGDLGGGSLEFVDVHGQHIGSGVTLTLGGLRLEADSEGDLAKAAKLTEKRLANASLLALGKGRVFYSVGGTWRAMAKLFMVECGYPLRVMHDYRIAAGDMQDFCKKLIKADLDMVPGIEDISKARRPLMPYGAIIMAKTLEASGVREVAISAIGVREGHLYQQLPPSERNRDALLVAAEELATLRARSPAHAHELIHWSDRVFEALGLDETADEVRLRKAACLLSDIGWRAHPDYRGEQSLNIVAHAGFIGIDHPGRAYLALSNYYRHSGNGNDDLSPRLRDIAGERFELRARALATSIRLAMLISAAMPGVIEQIRLSRNGGELRLTLPQSLAMLAGEKVTSRLKQLARINDLDPNLVIE